MSSDDRLMMEGRLSQLKQDLCQLEQRIESLCRGIRGDLNTALRPVQELDVPRISQQARDLQTAFVKMQSVLSRINRLNRELGNG